MIDEREHRRGLVLGLTLAEVLLLLLFLMMLALGSRFAKLDKAKRQLEKEIAAFKGAPLETSSIESPTWAPLPSQPEEPVDVMLNVEQQERLRLIVQAVVKIDPKDPPTVLKRALEQFQRTGLTPESQTAMSAALDQATKLNPQDPPAAISQGVKLLAELGSKTAVEPIKQCITAVSEGRFPAKGHDWPPIITLSEADKYFFQSGSANLTPEFTSKLIGTVTTRLLSIIATYDVNVIEVIGHTDEQPLVVRPSNLDTALLPYLQRTPQSPAVLPADNAGLGLARAASVVRVLTEDSRLSKLRILPLSAAQVITTGDTLSTGNAPGSVEQRRRIEIRVRRSDKDLTAELGPIQSAPEPKPNVPPAKVLKEQPRKPLAKQKSSEWFTSIFGQ